MRRRREPDRSSIKIAMVRLVELIVQMVPMGIVIVVLVADLGDARQVAMAFAVGAIIAIVTAGWTLEYLIWDEKRRNREKRQRDEDV
jgi:putative effector of murein hydrolase LrgA (UPF0299 family)